MLDHCQIKTFNAFKFYANAMLQPIESNISIQINFESPWSNKKGHLLWYIYCKLENGSGFSINAIRMGSGFSINAIRSLGAMKKELFDNANVASPNRLMYGKGTIHIIFLGKFGKLISNELHRGNLYIQHMTEFFVLCSVIRWWGLVGPSLSLPICLKLDTWICEHVRN